MQIIGFHAIEETIKKFSTKQGTATLFFFKETGRGAKVVEAARNKGVKLEKLDKKAFERFGIWERHRGFVLELEQERQVRKSVNTIDFHALLENLSFREESTLVLILDGITDPHNLGAILRSADQFGVNAVIIPEHRSASAGTTIMKTSAGAAAHVPLCTVKNLNRSVEALKQEGFWVYSAEMDGTSLYKTDFAQKSCIILGSEGKGVSRLLSEKSDHKISIPMQGHIDSLNVSVAAGIILYEFRR
jgi:23S rRNA (guanosine2251-2'-O)-methyltransferase